MIRTTWLQVIAASVELDTEQGATGERTVGDAVSCSS